MAVFQSCFIAVGTGVSNTGTFLEATTYTRPTLTTTGTALSGLTQAVGAFTLPTGPGTGTALTKGAIFDSLTGGNCLVMWDFPVINLTAGSGNFLAFTLNITFHSQVQAALNLALQGGQGSSGSLIDQGSQIGSCMGSPMTAGCRLNIAPGGNLTAHLGSGQWVGAMDVQNTLSVGGFAAGSVNNGIVALAGGANSALTPVLTGFVNRITTCATTNDSVALPPVTTAPTGSILWVINSGAAVAKMFPDTGAVINAAAAFLVIGIGTSCMMVRTTSLQWNSLPLLPS